jgi:MarR family transcriptional regulator, transcriptional regulator for hemolysin
MAKRPPRFASVDPAGEFPMDPALYYQHLTVVLALQREARLEQALRPSELSLAGFQALRVVNRFGSATMGELADYTLTDRTTLTRVVDELVEAGMMERHKPASDRRKVVLGLTETGRRAFDRAATAAASDMLDIMHGTPEAELRAAIRLQQRLISRLALPEQQLERLLWRQTPPAAKPRRSTPKISG